jgi:hypothetical protein
MNTSHNTTRSRAVQLSAITAIGTLTLAACGSDAATESTPTNAPADTEAPASTDMADMDDDDGMDMSEMNMGNPNATAAEDVEGAALARGEFALLDTRPQGYDDAAGTAVIARHSGGTTVTTRLIGLLPNVDYISHLHADACLPNNGGDHYQFEIGGSVMPPNEIHLAFTSDGDGNGFMTAENHAIADLDGVAFVVHPAEFLDNKIACLDFVEDSAGAAAAALEAGTSGMDHEGMDDDEDMNDGE